MELAKILSVSSVILAALWLIVPKGKTEQIFKYAMGLFIISVIISTINAASFTLPDNPSVTAKTVTDTAEKLSNNTAVYVIKNLLEKCNLKFGEIRIITDNSEFQSINITKAYVELDPADFSYAAEIIKNQTGIILVDGV